MVFSYLWGYFPVAGADGHLLPLFVAVNNTRIDDLEIAVSGHQRVLRARLEDALFFFREDKKKKLEEFTIQKEAEKAEAAKKKAVEAAAKKAEETKNEKPAGDKPEETKE